LKKKFKKLLKKNKSRVGKNTETWDSGLGADENLYAKQKLTSKMMAKSALNNLYVNSKCIQLHEKSTPNA
jgi:hypothetical protein